MATKDTTSQNRMTVYASQALIPQSIVDSMTQASRAVLQVIAPMQPALSELARMQARMIKQHQQFIETIRRTIEVSTQWIKDIVQTVQAVINSIVRPMQFLFTARPIYVVEQTSAPPQKLPAGKLQIGTNQYGFFTINGEQLNILHPASSRCGRLFAALLRNRAQVVSYDELKQEIGTGDLDKTFKDLKYQLKQAGYDFVYERPRTQGIALIGLTELQ